METMKVLLLLGMLACGLATESKVVVLHNKEASGADIFVKSESAPVKVIIKDLDTAAYGSSGRATVTLRQSYTQGSSEKSAQRKQEATYSYASGIKRPVRPGDTFKVEQRPDDTPVEFGQEKIPATGGFDESHQGGQTQEAIPPFQPSYGSNPDYTQQAHQGAEPDSGSYYPLDVLARPPSTGVSRPPPTQQVPSGDQDRYPSQEKIPDNVNQGRYPGQERIPDSGNQDIYPGQERIPDSGNQDRYPSQERIPDSGNQDRYPGQERIPDSGNQDRYPGQERIPDSGNQDRYPGQERIPDSGNQDRYPGSGNQERYPGQERIPASGNQDKYGSGGQTRYPGGNDGQTQTPGSGGQNRNPGFGGLDRHPGSGGQDRHPGIGGQDQNPISGGQDRYPGSGTSSGQGGQGQDRYPGSGTSSGQGGQSQDRYPGSGTPSGQGGQGQGHDHDHHHDDGKWLDVYGKPGQDFPIYNQVPDTGFKCGEQSYPGFYADIDAQCQVFHICQADGRQDSFLCPNATLFSQKYFVCDWWQNVDCSSSRDFYGLNANLYVEPQQTDRPTSIGLDSYGQNNNRYTPGGSDNTVPPISGFGAGANIPAKPVDSYQGQRPSSGGAQAGGSQPGAQAGGAQAGGAQSGGADGNDQYTGQIPSFDPFNPDQRPDNYGGGSFNNNNQPSRPDAYNPKPGQTSQTTGAQPNYGNFGGQDNPSGFNHGGYNKGGNQQPQGQDKPSGFNQGGYNQGNQQQGGHISGQDKPSGFNQGGYSQGNQQGGHISGQGDDGYGGAPATASKPSYPSSTVYQTQHQDNYGPSTATASKPNYGNTQQTSGNSNTGNSKTSIKGHSQKGGSW